jgi:oligo-1,6-glucosidase
MEADCLFLDALQKPFDLLKLKKAFSKWQYALAGKAWNALYLENHDHPRIISRYGSEKWRTQSGKMLANCYMLQRGTPFIYQGQELGMTNINLEDISLYQDVQTVNNLRTLRMLGMSKKKAEQRISRTTRGNARTPVQWDATANAGFTTGTPWMPVNPNYKTVNAQAEVLKRDSIFNHYRRLIAFRKKHPVAIHGEYKEHCADSRELYVYERSLEGKRILVICSFTEKPVGFWAPEGFDLTKGKPVLCNYPDNQIHGNGFTTRPYETRVYYFE